MEDAHTERLEIGDDPSAAFFAVYDGHGGSKVAEYAGDNLHNKILDHPSFSNNLYFFINFLINLVYLQNYIISKSFKIINYLNIYLENGQIDDAIVRGFLDIDQDMLNDNQMKDEMAGTTAICVILKNDKIYCVCIINIFRKN